MDMIIKNGTVILPDGPRKCDVKICGGKIAKIAPDISDGTERIIDAEGLIVSPGLVDIHCHLRTPGLEHKEDLRSGTAAAAHGGFTTICCMANTSPVNDTAAVTSYIINESAKVSPVHVRPIAALTKGLKGEQLTEVGDLAEAGAVALSDDGASVRDANRMRLGLSYAKRFGLKVISHPEDLDLTNGGAMNEGRTSTEIGLPGITRAAEETIMFRDCKLAEIENTSIHIAHVSTRGGVEIIRFMKDKGVRVTAETAPHYIYATDELARGYDTNTRVNPPLRTEDDRDALIDALLDGTIDCIATDHAPHHKDDKNVEYALAASGISGFETALGICWTSLVASGRMSAERMLEKMTSAPADILGIDTGRIVEGASADIVLIDGRAKWTVDPADFLSKGKNTPFAGDELTGRAVMTIAGGDIAYEEKR